MALHVQQSNHAIRGSEGIEAEGAADAMSKDMQKRIPRLLDPIGRKPQAQEELCLEVPASTKKKQRDQRASQMLGMILKKIEKGELK